MLSNSCASHFVGEERLRVLYKEYANFERNYSRIYSIEREITTVDNGKLEEIQTLCRQQGISINDYLIAEMMITEGTNKVVIAADIRNHFTVTDKGQWEIIQLLLVL